MTNEEAKLLVDLNLSDARKKYQSFLKRFMSTCLVLNAMAIPADIIVYIIANKDFFPTAVILHAVAIIDSYMISSDMNDENLRSRISLLKKIKSELNNNVNRFEKVNIYDFESKLNKSLNLIKTNEFI